MEEICFILANEHFKKEPGGDGYSVVQLYAKEISKLIIQVLKSGPNQKKDGDILDISRGRRDFLEADEAHELLSPLTDVGNSYTKIFFSNKSFCVDGARVTEPILTSHSEQLLEVNLSDFIAGRPEGRKAGGGCPRSHEDFLTTLENCDLKCLNLSNNAMGEKGVGSEGEIVLAESLGAYNYLKKLDLSDNLFGVEAGIALSTTLEKLGGLTELYLSYEGAISIFDALSKYESRLEILEVAGNDITTKAAPPYHHLFGRQTDAEEAELSRK